MLIPPNSLKWNLEQKVLRLPLAIPPGSLFLSASNDIKIRA